MPDLIRSDSRGVSFAVRIQPRASRNEVVGVLGDEIKIRITAPPVDGAANEALCTFLGWLFGVPARAVEIVSGRTGRRKVVHVAGLDPDKVLERLELT
ncbi:MAG: YggU family protein [Desulforudis sp.]|jgi:uncharacterized protein (TIGR00251 family)|nr:DUF167 domain-containing protein [Clostridia bacterium]MDQ7791426.1 DUF167 domain-containing protein [Clostridia bacterium]RJX16736.1 MAG: YggU family protein [Desulforudis sp.]